MVFFIKKFFSEQLFSSWFKSSSYFPNPKITCALPIKGNYVLNSSIPVLLITGHPLSKWLLMMMLQKYHLLTKILYCYLNISDTNSFSSISQIRLKKICWQFYIILIYPSSCYCLSYFYLIISLIYSNYVWNRSSHSGTK